MVWTWRRLEPLILITGMIKLYQFYHHCDEPLHNIAISIFILLTSNFLVTLSQKFDHQFFLKLAVSQFKNEIFELI